MLRITTEPSSERITIRVEGKLSRPFASALESCWATLVKESAVAIRVDLTGLTHLDDEGRELLVAMHARGAELVGTGCATRHLIAELTSS
jgi:ABC-type transporter Mla MlaB component